MVSPPLPEIVLAIATAVFGSVLYPVGMRLISTARDMAVRDFWHGFRPRAMIMTTEYVVKRTAGAQSSARTAEEDGAIELETDQGIAMHATSGYVLSYGMATAVSQLQTYFQRSLRTRVRIIGDKGHAAPRNDVSMVILGSPAANRYLRKFIGELARDYPLLTEFNWTVDPSGITLALPGGEILRPDIDENETGVDYTLIARFTLDPTTGTHLVVISGCNMWGTEAGARFLSDRRMITKLPPRTRRRRDALAFVLRVWVSQGGLDRIELFPSRAEPMIYDLASDGGKAVATPTAR